nr:hypothetical protein [Salmonid herpesvirus 1]
MTVVLPHFGLRVKSAALSIALTRRIKALKVVKLRIYFVKILFLMSLLMVGFQLNHRGAHWVGSQNVTDIGLLRVHHTPLVYNIYEGNITTLSPFVYFRGASVLYVGIMLRGVWGAFVFHIPLKYPGVLDIPFGLFILGDITCITLPRFHLEDYIWLTEVRRYNWWLYLFIITLGTIQNLVKVNVIRNRKQQWISGATSSQGFG